MKEFFQNLKQKRLEKKITLEGIHEKTRLPITYLEAIEAGELQKLPKGYERLYLRRYIREIGLDVEEVMRDFEVLTGRLTMPDSKSRSSKKGGSGSHKKKKKNKAYLTAGKIPGISKFKLFLENLNWDKIHKHFWISLALLVISGGGYFTYQQYTFEKENQIQIKEITISEIIEELQKRDSLLTPQLSGNTVIRTGGDGILRIELRARERTWIREIRDNRDTTEYILPPGLRRTIEVNQRVKLMLGRADGVEIWFNGRNLGLMGNADEVVLSLVLTQEGIIEKRLKKARPKEIITEDSSTVATVENFTRQ